MIEIKFDIQQPEETFPAIFKHIKHEAYMICKSKRIDGGLSGFILYSSNNDASFQSGDKSEAWNPEDWQKVPKDTSIILTQTD